MSALTATLDGMAEARMDTRGLAGSIVRDEMARAFLTVRKAASAWDMSTSTIQKVVRGDDESVSDLTLRSIEGGLGLPTRFLTYVIEGDAERIKRLPGRDVDPAFGLREDLRQYTIEALQDMRLPRRRRVGDR